MRGERREEDRIYSSGQSGLEHISERARGMLAITRRRTDWRRTTTTTWRTWMSATAIPRAPLARSLARSVARPEGWLSPPPRPARPPPWACMRRGGTRKGGYLAREDRGAGQGEALFDIQGALLFRLLLLASTYRSDLLADAQIWLMRCKKGASEEEEERKEDARALADVTKLESGHTCALPLLSSAGPLWRGRKRGSPLGCAPIRGRTGANNGGRSLKRSPKLLSLCLSRVRVRVRVRGGALALSEVPFWPRP